MQFAALRLQIAPPAFYNEWASPFNGRSEKSGIDEWKSRCNFPPAGGKVAPPAFNDGLGVPIKWAFRKWERPLDGNAIALDIRKRRGGVGGAPPRWGGGECVFCFSHALEFVR